MADPEPFTEEARFGGSANPRLAKTTELWDENDVIVLLRNILYLDNNNLSLQTGYRNYNLRITICRL